MKQSIKKITGDAPDREGGPRKKGNESTRTMLVFLLSAFLLLYYYFIRENAFCWE